MSGSAPLDLRLPVGGLLSALGLLLALYGQATRGNRLLYAPSGGKNLNLAWGLVMLACGIAFLAAAMWSRRRSARRAGAADRHEAATRRSTDSSGATDP